MPWLRLHCDVLNNRKIQRLEDGLFKVLVGLWCIARQDPEGYLPSIEDLAFALRRPVRDVQKLLDELLDAKFLDQTSDGRIRPHDWEEHQPTSDSSAERTKRYRDKHKSQ